MRDERQCTHRHVASERIPRPRREIIFNDTSKENYQVISPSLREPLLTLFHIVVVHCQGHTFPGLT